MFCMITEEKMTQISLVLIIPGPRLPKAITSCNYITTYCQYHAIKILQKCLAWILIIGEVLHIM